MLTRRAARPRLHRGLSLIELLVALLVASVGLLAFASLQAASLRHTHITQRRVVATLLAEDFIERLRANTINAADVQAYEVTESFEIQAAQPLAAIDTSCEGPAASCAVQAMADYDLAQVRRHARALLQSDGALFAKLDPADPEGRTLDLWVAWREPLTREPAAVLRPADECPAGLDVADDFSVRCLRWRVRR